MAPLELSMLPVVGWTVCVTVGSEQGSLELFETLAPIYCVDSYCPQVTIQTV